MGRHSPQPRHIHLFPLAPPPLDLGEDGKEVGWHAVQGGTPLVCDSVDDGARVEDRGRVDDARAPRPRSEVP